MISMKKIGAIFMMKMKSILKNSSILLGPLMAIGFVLLYQNILPSDGVDEKQKVAFVLQMGILFNVLMTGIMATSMPLAEEKEKNTLRVLMTSSVKGSEFFIGSALPVIIILTFVNLIILPIGGAEDINIIMYLGITTMANIITMILGMVLGIAAKTQMSASLLSTPLMLVLLMVPMFSAFNEGMAKVSGFIYTGVLNESVVAIVTGSGTVIDTQGLIVFAAWFVISVVAFLVFYKKNGLEND